MRKLGPVGLKWLKVIHIVFVGLMFGGIISSVAINALAQITVIIFLIGLSVLKPWQKKKA